MSSAVYLYIYELCSFSNHSVTSPTSQLILQTFRRFTYVTAHSPTLPLLHLRHSSFSNPSFASAASQALHLIHLASRPLICSGIWGPIQHLSLKITNSLANSFWLRKPLKPSIRLAGHGIWTRDLPNASLVRYHGATSLGFIVLSRATQTVRNINARSVQFWVAIKVVLGFCFYLAWN